MKKADSPPDIAGLKFLGKLGSGGYADVFLYDQATPQRKVAVKVLRETGLSAAAIQRFTAEANAMAQLEHPYIVGVYATGTTLDHRPYIAMMYYPRESLAERARSERFSVAETLQLGIQLGSAVETAHRAGLLHRDIKPANVLTSAYGRPGLTDFGIAGQMSDKDDEDVGVSVPWSPPETLYATAPATVRSDVYSLAATLWQLLVGRSPFEIPGGDNSPFALMRRIRDVPPPPTGRADVPASLDRLLVAAMGKEATLRPASALELVGALQAIEQELRLPRTPLELASENVVASPRLQLGSDRTQVRAPQVVSASDGLPQVKPGPVSFAPQDATGPDTRRSADRLEPIGGYDEGVEGETVLRGAQVAKAEAPASPEQGSARRVGLIGLAVAVLLVVGGVIWALSSMPAASTGAQTAPPVTVSADPPVVGQQLPPPGKPVITCKTASAAVVCTWTYLNPAPKDQFEWRIVGTTQVNPTDQPRAVISNATSGCVEVKVFRYDGSYAPPEWTRGCTP